MSSRRVEFRIQDILVSIDKILKYTSKMTLKEFRKNSLVIDAVVRNFEVIGEASVHIPQNYRRKHPDIPWADMIGMRNVMIHEYFGIDVDTVWKTIRKHLPILKTQLEDLNIQD